VVVNAAQVAVDLGAYRHNLAQLTSAVVPAKVMAVVKADAYGHGLTHMAHVAVAAGISALGTLDIESALQLRASGIGSSTMILAWLLSPTEPYGEAIAAGIDLGVSTIDQLTAIADAVGNAPARVHLKIDTGLHRNGASQAEWPALVTRAVELALCGRVVLVGAWTHIAEASYADDSDAIRRFHEALAVAKSLGAVFTVRHLAASSAGYSRADARFDLVRVGAFGYGISPGGGVTPASLGLLPVMTVSAPVSSVDGNRARVAIGYSDGVSTSCAGVVAVAVDGARYEVLDVEIDHLVIGIGGAQIKVGARAVLFGDGTSGEQSLQDWADAIGTIGEEVVTRLSARIERIYVD